MTWREAYEAGSFRGAPFRTAGHERSGGRRVAVIEFPGRDEPLVEDLGRRARQFAIDCHVVGTDYRAARDRLLDALDAEGTGLLVHPWHGRMMVAVLDYQSSESTEEGGLCRFQITFTEAGQPAPAPVAVAAGNDAARAAELTLAQAPQRFAARFSIDDAADFVEQGAAGLVDGMAEVAQLAAGLRGGVGPMLRAFDAGLRFLPDLGSLLRAPLRLGQSVVGLVQAVGALGGSSAGRRMRLTPLQTMLDWEPSQPVFPDRTPQRRIEATNRIELLQLFRGAVAAELVRQAAAIDYPGYEDAQAARAPIAARLDQLALAAADRGDDAGAETFDGLRRALVRDLTRRGASLARVYRVELAAAEPVLAVAHRHYGNAAAAAPQVEGRAAELVARNRLAHPGFAPAGVPLELLTADLPQGRTAA